jgi:hypothetical protein
MALPALTDSLYKFLTVSGLALLVGSCSFGARIIAEFRRSLDVAVSMDSLRIEHAWRLARLRELRSTYPGLGRVARSVVHTTLSDTLATPSSTAPQGLGLDYSRSLERLAALDLQPAECTRQPNGYTKRDTIPCAVILEVRTLERAAQHAAVRQATGELETRVITASIPWAMLAGAIGIVVGFIVFIAGAVAWFLGHQLPHDLTTYAQLVKATGSSVASSESSEQ